MGLGTLTRMLWIGTRLALAPLTLSSLSCDNEKLGSVDYCAILENHRKIEICNNGIDDNCNGQFDEDCDKDNDGYCNQKKIFAYTPEIVPSVCEKSYEQCVSLGNCAEGVYRCDTKDNPPQKPKEDDDS